ncbi:MAG: hypothetical protein IJB18_07260 [Clostridia bacterium]|nr:hypothetical protein [Clostridia bacterium]
MEDFAVLLIAFVVYLVFGSASQKKKQNARKRNAEKRGPIRTRTQGARQDAREAGRTRETEKGFAEAFGQSTQKKAGCETRPLHLHEVTQSAFERAQEGEDPCHAGGAYDFDSDAPQSGTFPEETGENPAAQDILRGVIMSEILTRPSGRMAAQRSRR